MRFYATEQLSENISKTPEGFLICAEVPAARTGLQVYAPGEVPDDIQPAGDGSIMIERQPEDVFDPVTLASAQGKPFVNEHPLEGDERVDVDPANWKKYLAGTVLNPRRGAGITDDLMFVDIIVYDPDTIDAIVAGKRELSVGYEANYEVLGVGRAKQTQIRVNHIALVDSGRCGARCSIRDGVCSLHGRRVSTDEFKEFEHPRDPQGEFASGGGSEGGKYDPSDPAVRNIKTSFPVVSGVELRKIYNQANREADKRGELSKAATEYPIERVPIKNIVATQPGLNSNLVQKYQTNPPEGHAAGIMFGGKLYLRDGHHRAEAAKRRGDEFITAHVQRVGRQMRDSRSLNEAPPPARLAPTSRQRVRHLHLHV